MNTYSILENLFSSKLDKDFKSKGNKSLSSFKRVNTDIKRLKNKNTNSKLLKYIDYNNNTESYTWFDRDELVAIVAVDHSHKYDNYDWITAIEVTNEYQGYGLGKQLLDFAVKNMK